MSNTIIVDLTDPKAAKEFANCEIGVPKEMTITVMPTAKSDTQFIGQITEMESQYSDAAEPEVEEEAPPIITEEKKSPAAFPLK